MTSLWTNAELVYSMPTVGPTKTTTTASVVSAAAAAEFSLNQLWPMGNMLGKSLSFKAGGTFDAGAVTNTVQLYADTTVSSQSSGVALAASGAVTLTSETVGMWGMTVDATCVTQAANTTGWVFDGLIWYGVNASTAAILGTYTVGGANTLGVPTTVALVPTTSYYWELWSTFGTAPTAFVCSKYKIYAEN